jgi:hypothetical protein
VLPSDIFEFNAHALPPSATKVRGGMAARETLN